MYLLSQRDQHIEPMFTKTFTMVPPYPLRMEYTPRPQWMTETTESIKSFIHYIFCLFVLLSQGHLPFFLK